MAFDFDVADGCRALRVSASGKALQVYIPAPISATVWVPKSVISWESEVKCPGDTGILIVKPWWAKKAGLHPNSVNYIPNKKKNQLGFNYE
jgi:hypothetical protein